MSGMRNNLIWITGIVVILAGILLAGIYGPDEVWKGVLWGSLISCFLNFLGFFAVRYSFTRSFKLLLSSIVAGPACENDRGFSISSLFQAVAVNFYNVVSDFICCLYLYLPGNGNFFFLLTGKSSKNG